MKKIKIKLPKKKPRNPVALPAKQMKAGPMKDRRSPRGGAINKQDKWLEEVEEDREDKNR